MKGGEDMAAYKWKLNGFYSATADQAAQAFKEIESKTKLTAEAVVEYSKPEDSVLHNDFEWNDDVAAHQYRLQQARCMIGNLTVTVEQDDSAAEPVRAYFHIAEKKAYERAEVVVQDEDKMASVRKEARRELEAFERKYRRISGLSEILSNIRQFLED